MGPLAMVALLGSGSAWAGVKASSEATTSDGVKHVAAFAVDGLLSTGWAEGDSGGGTGAWLEIKLDRPTDVRTVSIWPGRIAQGSRGLREHGRPHTVTITLLGGPEEVSKQVRVLDIAETGPTRLDVPIEGKATAVKVTYDEVTTGGIYDDTYLTEVAINFLGGDASPTMGALGTWMASEAGQKAALAHEEEVTALKAVLGEAEFMDREQFAQLKDAASDGPLYLRDKVKAVADGFRIQALAPSSSALNALLALEDANAIAPLELAATRTTGELQAALKDRVSRFGALQELKGGGNRNVPPWGEPGFCKGCLRSFGEPLGLAVDAFGGVWVADLANHRVQQFDFQGIARKQIGGGEPSISDNWLGAKRGWYAAGATAGSMDGSFALPLAIAVLPDKKAGDGALVLDAAGRVSVIGPSGAVTRSWSIGIDDAVSPGVGGEAHLAVAGKNMVAIWGKEAYVFTLEGTSVGKFTLQEGVASGVVGFKNGKIGALFADELVLYSPDGFRHAALLGDTVPDGWEFWTAALDEKGKLWIVTDHGWAVKYKKPGVVDVQVRLVDYSFGPPRADVYQDLVFVSDPSRDRIEKFDALELAARAAAAPSK